MSDKWTNARKMLTKCPHLHLDNTQCLELLDEQDKLAKQYEGTKVEIQQWRKKWEQTNDFYAQISTRQQRAIEVMKHGLTELYETEIGYGESNTTLKAEKYIEWAERILKGKE